MAICESITEAVYDIEVTHLSRRFGDAYALNDVSLRTPRACVHGLVGMNGAGKTTLIKHLLGLYRAASGSVRVLGMDPVRQPKDVLRRIGYLSEDRDMPEWMRVRELMWYTRAFHPAWDQAFADELLATFAIDPEKKVKNLSSGMRAQVGLVAAVAHRPDLLLLDEPSSGLDAVVRRDILNAIVRAVADDARTILFSSHLLDEVEQLSDYITMIDGGRVIIDGELDAIREQHQMVTIRKRQPDGLPSLEGMLSLEGGDGMWTGMYTQPIAQLREALLGVGAELTDTRCASLQEIFLARVGRRSAVAAEH